MKILPILFLFLHQRCLLSSCDMGIDGCLHLRQNSPRNQRKNQQRPNPFSAPPKLSLGEATTTITGIKTEFDTFDTGTPINLADMKLAVQTEIKKILEFASKHDHDGLCQYFASSSAGDNQKAAKANTYYGGIGHGIRSSLGFATKKDKKLEEDHQKQQQQEQQKRDHGLDENDRPVFLIDLARMLSLGAALAQNVLAEYADAKKQMKIKLALDGFPLDEAKYREYQTNLWHKADSAIIMYLKHTKLNTAHWGRKQMMLDADFRKTKGEILRQLKSVALVEFRRGDSSANLISDDKGHRLPDAPIRKQYKPNLKAIDERHSFSS